METKACKQCGTSYSFTEQDTEFYNKISPTINWVKQNIPSPSLCPDCRQQRRLSWINQRKLYRGTCAFSNKPILSIYSPESGYKIYDYKVWWSDQWSPLDYGQNFDFSKPFFQQFEELMKEVPYPNLSIINSENSEFNHNIADCKNCYMCFGNNNLENTYYASESMYSSNSSDIWWSGKIENSYEMSSCANMYKCYYCYNSDSCSDSIFLQNCSWCNNCIMCFGLQNAKYYIKNKQYSKEEFEKKKQEMNLWNYNNLQAYITDFHNFLLTQAHKCTTIVNSENCNGDYIFDSNNCENSFNIVGVKNSKNLYEWWRVSNVQDATFVYDDEWYILECTGVFGNSFHILFSEYVFNSSSNLIYCSNMSNSKNCFWCVGLRDQEYCILNKQYSKDDYEKIVSKIIDYMKTTWEWGEFLPISTSRFAYNETAAQEYYPLDWNWANEAINFIENKWIKYKWLNKDYPVNIPPTMPTINANELIVDIKDLSEEYEKQLLNSAIICEASKKPFRFTKSELDFYKKLNISLPRKSHDVRHMERMKLRNPRKLYDRKCDKCEIDMKTTYAPDREEIVYCKACYEKKTY